MPHAPRPRAVTADERGFAFDVAREHASHPLSVVGLLSGKDIHVVANDAGTRGFVAHTRVGPVALALGDPVASRGSLQAVAEDFAAGEREKGARAVAYLSASEDAREALASSHAGAKPYAFLPIGAEPVLDLDSFSLEGRAMKSLRGACNRGRREGIRVVEHEPDGPYADDIMRVAEAWLDARGGSVQAYTDVPLFDDEAPRWTRRIFLALREERVLAASLVTAIPGREGWNMHLVRRDPRAPRGTMELLDVETLRILADEGARCATWGLCPFKNLDETRIPTRLASGVEAVVDRLVPAYHVDGVAAYKAKFRPQTHEPRYLAFSPKAALPLVALASVRAQAGGLGSVLRRA